MVGSVDSVGLNPQPYEWTNGVVTPLTLPSGFTDGTALGVSNDGTAIVGFMMPPLSTENKAFIWTQANGVQDLQQVLQQVLTADGLGSELTGWTLTEATAITADGKTIVGNGVDPQGQDEGWIANLSTSAATAPSGTVTTLQASTQNPIYRQPITVTATVGASPGASGTPTGSVTFQDGLMTLGSAPLYNGMGSLTISSLPVGIYPITANYSGNAQSMTARRPPTSRRFSQTPLVWRLRPRPTHPPWDNRSRSRLRSVRSRREAERRPGPLPSWTD